MKEQKAFDAMIEQGFSQLREGQFEDAIETFSIAHSLEAHDDRPLRGRGLAAVQLGNAISAEADFRAALAANQSEPENAMGLGVSLALQNKVYEAISVFDELLKRNPQYVAGYIQLGRLYIKIGVIAKAKDNFKLALQHKPSLEQRRTVEGILKEQEKLDAGRYYRPDFDRLRKQTGDDSMISKLLKTIFGDAKKKVKQENASCGRA